MLKRRVVLLLTFLDGVLFRTKKFVPDYRYSLNFVDLTDADEAVCIHLGGDWDNFVASVRKIGDEAGIPLTVGGGIRSLEQFNACMRELPCDKVLVRAGHWGLIQAASSKWGNQAVVVGVTRDGLGYVVRKHINLAVRDGAGEILLQSVERDGSLLGYDPSLLAIIRDIPVPVVIGSGAGAWGHLKEGFEAGADGCATSNIFHFSAPSLRACKNYLLDHEIDVRPVV